MFRDCIATQHGRARRGFALAALPVLLVALGALAAPRGYAEGEDAEGPPKVVEATPKPYDLMGDGKTRLTLKDGDFSIVPPKGWEVFKELPTLTLLMQVPHEPDMRYQRTVQVASFNGSRFIDEVTAKEFEETIVAKFSKASAGITDYRLRNHMKIEMADGQEALLFYTEFTSEAVPLMQAHILLSSDKRHYLVTFTDLAEHFENEEQSQFLSEAWESMISAQLGGKAPARVGSLVMVAVGVGVLLVAVVLLGALRYWRSGKAYRELADGKGLDDVDLDGDQKDEDRAAEEYVSGVEEGENSVAPKKRDKKKEKEAASLEFGDSMPPEEIDDMPKASGT
jgi:hypothetical protein